MHKIRTRKRDQWRRWKRTYRAKKKARIEAERRARSVRANDSIKEAIESFLISNIIRIMAVSPPEVQAEIATRDYIGYS